MNLKENEILKCPKCGAMSFCATAHVTQDWVLDEKGNFLRSNNDCVEVTHFPDANDVWDCNNCGYSSSGSDFITTEQAVSTKGECHEDFSNVIEEEKYLMGEIIFDITTCASCFIMGLPDGRRSGEYDSRELYACIFEWSKEFEKKYPAPGFDYLLLVEEFAYVKLREYFELEG